MPSDKRDQGQRRRAHAGDPSPRRHHHKTSDSGVGSLSDHDGLASGPDRFFAAQDYSSHTPNSVALQRLLEDNTLELERLKLKNKELEVEKQIKTVENQELGSKTRDLNRHAKLLEADNKTINADNKALLKENNELRQQNADLRAENDRLADRVRRYRGGSHDSLYDSSGSHSTDPQPSSLKRRDSRKEKETERLRGRFDKTQEKGFSSVQTSNTGRARRSSYVEPFGPSARPSLVVQTIASSPQPPNSSRSYSSYTTTSVRPPAVATSSFSVPRSPQVANYNEYAEATNYEEYKQTGDYVPEPLPERRHKR